MSESIPVVSEGTIKAVGEALDRAHCMRVRVKCEEQEALMKEVYRFLRVTNLRGDLAEKIEALVYGIGGEGDGEENLDDPDAVSCSDTGTRSDDE